MVSSVLRRVLTPFVTIPLKGFNYSPVFSVSAFILLLCASISNAQQINEYIFSQSNGTYTPITGGTVIASATGTSGANGLDDVNFSGTIPFTFTIKGIAYTAFNINTNGNITFGATPPSTSNYTPISSSTAYEAAVSAMGKDLWGVYVTTGNRTSGSPIITGVTSFFGLSVGEAISGAGIPTGTTVLSFDSGAGTITLSANATTTGTGGNVNWPNGEIRTEAIGTAPNRTFIIQYSGFADFGSTLPLNCSFDFQIHLEEGGGILGNQIIRTVYGSHANLNTTARNNQVGLRGSTNADYNNRSSATDWSATIAGISNSATVTRTNTIFPSSGLTFSWIPATCFGPSALTAISFSHNSGNLSWTAPTIPPSSGYVWEVRTSGAGGSGNTGLVTSGSTLAGVTMAVANGLTASTTYSVYVRGYCGGTDYSTWTGPTNFSTQCSPTTPPYSQDFSSYTGAAPATLTCWSEYENGSPPASPVGPTTSQWTSDGFGNNGTSGAAKITLSSNVDRDWLVSPLFNLSGGPYLLKADFSLTTSGSTTQGVFGADDEVKVLISSDFGASWTTLETFNTGNTPPAAGVTKSYDLSAYSNMTVLIAFWGNEGAATNTTCEFFVDNILLEIPTACASPSTLTATSPTVNGATLGWTEQGSATLWDLEIILSSETPTGNPTNDNVSTNPFVWTGGMPMTSYKFYVRADCGGTGVSNWVGPLTFLTVPSNDECVNAIAFPSIPNDGTCATISASTAGATQSQAGCAGTADDDIWFSFVATTTTHLIEVTTVSGNADRVHQVFSGTCGALVSILCSDPETSTVNGLTIGQTYYLRIHTYGSGTVTSVNICIKQPPPPPANDDCSGAISLIVNPDPTCTTSANGSTVGATQSTETAPTCGPTGVDDDVWYTFVATSTAHIFTLSSVTGTSTDMAMSLYSGNCGSLTHIQCSDPNVMTVTGLMIGTSYTLRVWTWFTSGTASFTLCITTPPSMSYVSSTTTHPVTTAIPAGSVNERILRVAVVVSGLNNPLDLTQLNFNTNGSTDPSADILNARVFYTGTSTTFSTANQFGSTVNNPNGSFNVSGSQILTGGVSNTTNYFFLAYDIACASIPPNVVDAECTQITVDADYTPTVTAPANNRAIAAAAYTASNAQGPTTNVFTGTSENSVIRVQLSGCAGTTVTSINFTTGLSNNPATDIESATVYYTTSTTFDNLTPFGSPVSNPNGAFTVNGSQTLDLATGYFWLTYSIPLSATVNNVVDASAESAVINSITAIPTLVNPTGTRTIKAIPLNDVPSGAIPITLNMACSGAPYTNEFSTLGVNEPTVSCVGSQTSANSVWYSFVAPSSGFVRISTDHATGTLDTRIGVFSAPSASGPFTILTCDDDNGFISAAKSIVYVNSLSAGQTYYVAVDHWNGAGTGTFCLEIYEVTAAMLSPIGDCGAGETLFSVNQNYNSWLTLLDGSGNLRAMVRNPSGTGTGTFDYGNSQNINFGAIRKDGNQIYYLDRNYLITNAAATNVDVQLFFTSADFEALQDADPTIFSLTDLKVTRRPGTTCVLGFNPPVPSTLLNQTGNGEAAFYWIQFHTPSLGNFFIHGGSTALPINLLSFDGIAMKNYNKVMWFTENEINFDQFEVQRASSTSGQFTTIGTIKGGQQSGGSYFFDDMYPVSSGFYRLKMMDLDGQFSYSKVITIKRAGTAFAIRNVFPNPSTDFVNVELTSPEEMEIYIMLVDITGKEVRTITTNLTEGDQSIQFSLEGIQPGTYFLNVLGQVSKVVKL